jgi:hypothetical protein
MTGGMVVQPLAEVLGLASFERSDPKVTEVKVSWG